jgi:regulator of chromosome condensation
VRIQATPALVFEPASAEERVTAISSGADHVLLLCADGSVRSFGCAEKGRLGRLSASDADTSIGDAQPDARPALKRRVLMPTLVPGLGNVVAVTAVRVRVQTTSTLAHAAFPRETLLLAQLNLALACAQGFYCSFALNSAGHVFAWGLNNYGACTASVLAVWWPLALTCRFAGQLGMPQAEVNEVYVPRRVPVLEGAPRRAASCASEAVANTLTCVYALASGAQTGRGVKALASGEHHTLALTDDGVVLSFGRPTYGRLGRPGVNVEGDEAEHDPQARSIAAFSIAPTCVRA